ncbi:four helix bundle protein [Bacteroidota bacterium]
MLQSFKQLKTWRAAHNLVLSIYSNTKSFPKEEKFGLISQIRRAAVSIPANIAEGRSRYGIKEFLRFLYISRGSLEEVKYLLILSKDLGFLANDSYSQLEDQTDETGRLLNAMINSLKVKL